MYHSGRRSRRSEALADRVAPVAIGAALMYVLASMGLRGERYETLRVIASGGMATVHLGRALGMGGFERLVAIKVMHPHLASEPECVSMFLDEARLAARIRHPNVVSTLDVQQDDEGVFLVMDYIEGPSLQQAIRPFRKSQQPFPLDVALRILLDALAGLHAAHELKDGSGKPLNLVHRDVSPQNILIGSDGIARITDFGVARAEARFASTQDGQLKGKLAYMAPEQVLLDPIDRRVDVYAAGVLLWELLTGARLMNGSTETALLAVAANATHQPPRSVNPSVPAALDEVCMRALKREPNDRFATAADFAEAIESAADAEGQKIASGRAVAAFIDDLKAHARAVDLPEPQSARGSGGSSSGSARAPSDRVDRAGPASDARGAPTSDATKVDKVVTSQTPAPSTQTSMAKLTAAEPLADDRGRAKRLLIGAFAVAIVSASIAALLFGRGAPDQQKGAEPAAANEGSSKPASSPLALSSNPRVEPAPSASATSSAQASAIAIEDAGAPNAEALKAQTGASSEKPAGATKPGTGKPGQGTIKAGSGGAVYRPPEL